MTKLEATGEVAQGGRHRPSLRLAGDRRCRQCRLAPACSQQPVRHAIPGIQALAFLASLDMIALEWAQAVQAGVLSGLAQTVGRDVGGEHVAHGRSPDWL